MRRGIVCAALVAALAAARRGGQRRSRAESLVRAAVGHVRLARARLGARHDGLRLAPLPRAARDERRAGGRWSAQALPAALLAAADRSVPRRLLIAGAVAERPLRRRRRRLDLRRRGRAHPPVRRTPTRHCGPRCGRPMTAARSWTRQTLPGARRQSLIYDLEAADGTAYLLLANAQRPGERLPDAGRARRLDAREHALPARPGRRRAAVGRDRPRRLDGLAGRGQRPRHRWQRAPRRRPLGRLDAAVRGGRPQLRDPGRLEPVRPRRDVRDGRLRLPALAGRPEGRQARLDAGSTSRPTAARASTPDPRWRPPAPETRAAAARSPRQPPATIVTGGRTPAGRNDLVATLRRRRPLDRRVPRRAPLRRLHEPHPGRRDRPGTKQRPVAADDLRRRPLLVHRLLLRPGARLPATGRAPSGASTGAAPHTSRRAP